MRWTLLALALLGTSAAPLPRVVSQIATPQRIVALTFDAGADRGYAARILGVLEQRHIRATFGMTGRWAAANRALVKRMARDGDVIINHTYDHRSFTGFSTRAAPLTAAQRAWEVTHADRIIQNIIGHSTRPYFRPPYGDYDPAVLRLVRRLGYRIVVMWTVDSLGWTGLSAPLILHRCLSLTRPGAILLMHVGVQSQDAFALPGLVSGLRSRGYRFVTVPRLLRGH